MYNEIKTQFSYGQICFCYLNVASVLNIEHNAMYCCQCYDTGIQTKLAKLTKRFMGLRHAWLQPTWSLLVSYFQQEAIILFWVSCSAQRRPNSAAMHSLRCSNNRKLAKQKA